MTNKNKKPLNFDDLFTLDAKSTVNWQPKDPRELLLPYLSNEQIIAETDIDKRRKKGKEVYDGYNQLEQKCNLLKQEIENNCKNVEVSLSSSNQLDVISAVQRTFGTDGNKITFEMYKKALEKLHEIADQNIAKV